MLYQINSKVLVGPDKSSQKVYKNSTLTRLRNCKLMSW